MKDQEIILETIIKAPIERCFLLSLNVDLHTRSVEWSNEKAVAGVIHGTMEAGDLVTWQANHFGIKMHMTTKISAYNSPVYFVSEMVKGPFKKIFHQHYFEISGDTTLMKDHFSFRSPLGIAGYLMDVLFLKKYMRQLLLNRNETITKIAEGRNWEKYTLKKSTI